MNMRNCPGRAMLRKNPTGKTFFGQNQNNKLCMRGSANRQNLASRSNDVMARCGSLFCQLQTKIRNMVPWLKFRPIDHSATTRWRPFFQPMRNFFDFFTFRFTSDEHWHFKVCPTGYLWPKSESWPIWRETCRNVMKFLSRRPCHKECLLQCLCC